MLGALLLLVAIRQWRGRPRGDADAALPGWMRTIDRFTPHAHGDGRRAVGHQPEEPSADGRRRHGDRANRRSAGQQAIALAVFVLIGTLGPACRWRSTSSWATRATRMLDDLKNWMGHNNAAIVAVLCLVIGAKLIGDGISAL